MFNETRRPHLVAIHGEAKVKAMEAALAPAAAALKAAGKEVNFKDLEDALAATEASAAAAPSVPTGNAAAGAPSEKDAAAALAGIVVAAVKEAVKPIEARLTALETPVAPRTAEEIALAAVKEAFGPRVTPAPGSAPSESAATVINGNNGMVQQAKAASKDDGVPGVPDHLQYYFKNGAANLLGSFNAMGGLPDADGVAAAVAAASGQPAGVS